MRRPPSSPESHPAAADLADVVLGTAARETRGAVQQHLAGGCARCTRQVAALRRLRRVSLADAGQPAPDGAVRTVKALFSFRRQSERPRLVPMRLSFDSLTLPAVAGARNLQSSSRHLVFYSPDFALDLRMDFERAARETVVVGQLLNRDWGPLGDVPAYLVSGGQVLAHTVTGDLGEFHMECQPKGSLKLRLSVTDDELIEVELDRRRQSARRPPASTAAEWPGLALPNDLPAAKPDPNSGDERP